MIYWCSSMMLWVVFSYDSPGYYTVAIAHIACIAALVMIIIGVSKSKSSIMKTGGNKWLNSIGGLYIVCVGILYLLFSRYPVNELSLAFSVFLLCVLCVGVIGVNYSNKVRLVFCVSIVNMALKCFCWIIAITNLIGESSVYTTLFYMLLSALSLILPAVIFLVGAIKNKNAAQGIKTT